MKWKKINKEFSKLRSAIMTNQSGFSLNKMGDYHFEYFRKNWNLTHLFLPEHGLFAELQDQVSGSSLKYDYGSLKIINLYGDDENSLSPNSSVFSELDLVIIDIRDVGARYYTFLTTAYYLLQGIHNYNLNSNRSQIEVLVMDSPNPAGKKVEGSPLKKEFESFVGVSPVVHRHGLSPAGLLLFYKEHFTLNLKIHICEIGEIYPDTKSEMFWVPPSPNIPTKDTCLVYSGQCLLEGTNLSEGRGTTRPFEIFGAPFINVQDSLLLSQIHKYKDESYHLRPLYFQPTFHKHAGQICGGFQILVLNKKFHSLLFTLHFLRTIKDYYSKEFSFLNGPYEFRSDKRAIELLAGDEYLIEYLEGMHSYKEVKEYLTEQESIWTKKTREYQF